MQNFTHKPSCYGNLNITIQGNTCWNWYVLHGPIISKTKLFLPFLFTFQWWSRLKDGRSYTWAKDWFYCAPFNLKILNCIRTGPELRPIVQLKFTPKVYQNHLLLVQFSVWKQPRWEDLFFAFLSALVIESRCMHYVSEKKFCKSASTKGFLQESLFISLHSTWNQRRSGIFLIKQLTDGAVLSFIARNASASVFVQCVNTCSVVFAWAGMTFTSILCVRKNAEL